MRSCDQYLIKPPSSVFDMLRSQTLTPMRCAPAACKLRYLISFAARDFLPLEACAPKDISPNTFILERACCLTGLGLDADIWRRYQTMALRKPRKVNRLSNDTTSTKLSRRHPCLPVLICQRLLLLLQSPPCVRANGFLLHCQPQVSAGTTVGSDGFEA